MTMQENVEYIEVRMDAGSNYTDPDNRNNTLAKLENTKLPVRILINSGYRLSPVESEFCKNLINEIHKKGGRILITRPTSGCKKVSNY